MSLSISGTVTNRQPGRGTAGLWLEVRHEGRMVARAAEATNDEGRFRIEADDRTLGELLGDSPATLTFAVRRDDDSEVALVEPAVVVWPLERERVELELVVDLPNVERPPVRIEDVSGLLDRPVPDALLDRLRNQRIQTLADIRAVGGLNHLQGLTEAQARAALKLEAHARLEVVSTDAVTNARLIGAGFASATDLVRADAATLAGETGIELAMAQSLKERALTQRWMIDHELADALISHAPVNSVYMFDKTVLQKKPWVQQFLPAQPDPDSCQSCEPCTSALSPAAYLVDLIDFLIDNFKQVTIQTGANVQPKGFPDLKAIEDRFYRPFGALLVDCERADQSVCQIEIAIEVLEPFVMHVAARLREDVYAAFDAWPSGPKPRFPKPDVLLQMFDAYLGELGIARADFDAAIEDAYPASSSTQADMTKLNALLARLGVTEVDLKSGLDLKANWKPHIEALDWLPELVRTAKTKGLDPNDVTKLAAYTDAIGQAEAAISRVKDTYLPDIRANLISYAIYPLPETRCAAADVRRLPG